MKKQLNATIITTGLAIFSMLFGAGNLVYPLQAGLRGGENFLLALVPFLLASIGLPLLGLIAMALFKGNYEAFFYRLGKAPGATLISFCMLVIGPIIAMPRIVTISYTMVAPFIPGITPLIFVIAFLGITFLCTFRESTIINLLGHFISPALLAALAIIIGKGILANPALPGGATLTPSFFWDQWRYGYNTLDLLGTIFFSSMTLHILSHNLKPAETEGNTLTVIALKAGLIGAGLLGIVYLGMGYLGAAFGTGLGAVNEAELFSAISFRVLNSYGTAIISIAVLMACFSTIIALAAVVAEYTQHTVFRNRLGYVPALAGVLIATGVFALMGFSQIMAMAKPVIGIGYPLIIATTVCNIAYKWWNFKPIKGPVAAVFIAMLISAFLG